MDICGTKYEKPLNLSQSQVFLNGADKAVVWSGPPHLVPTPPTWTELRAVSYNPRLTRKDAATFRAEEDWSQYHRQRHTPSGFYGHSVGTVPSGVPGLRLDGYTRHIHGMPPRDIFHHRWPKADSWMPPARAPRGEYYGYYHEAIESERFMRDRLRTTRERITPFDIPKVTSLSCKQVHRDVDCDLAGGLN